MNVRSTVTGLFSGFVFALVLAGIPGCSKAEEASPQRRVIHHDLKVVLYPKEHRFTAEDTVTVPEGHEPESRFLLHGGLYPASGTAGVSIVSHAVEHTDSSLGTFTVKLPHGVRTFVVRYGGTLYHPIEPYGKEQARGFSRTSGIISEEGVYLGGGSLWYPTFDQPLLTFTLQVELPPDWDAVSQGERTLHAREKGVARSRWESPEPQDEIFLIAGKFTEYTRQAGRVLAMAFLRTPDAELAAKYLDATARYLTMYEKLIGPYPYKKFALVENFWETGFGMPSFTLLGPKVIRFPFIINSSYPHEILHNWWGNSVFPDLARGNWSEGLTAYLSDHLIKEQQGAGAEYREATLQKYADYVRGGRDFPLRGFLSRHSASSEAIGYGKSLMFFHMLRRALGDRTFIAGLQNFYQRNKFAFASFDDLRRSFDDVSGKDLKDEFDQWIERTGAPELKLSTVTVEKEGEGYMLTGLIEQIQPGEAYFLFLPLAVTMEGRERAYQAVAAMDKKTVELKLKVPSLPLRLDVDPEFDLFRRLDREEIPPALSQALGAEKMLILLPSSADSADLKAYREFAKVLAQSGPDAVEIKLDSDVSKLPSDRAVTVLGWENRLVKEAASALSGYGVTLGDEVIGIEKTEVPRKNHSVALTIRNPQNRDMALTLICSSLSEALPGLGRKLPHYHKYSYLLFEGDEPTNVAKGRWPVLESPMSAFLPGRDGRVSRVGMATLSARQPLGTVPSAFSSDRMIDTLEFLSKADLRGRGFGTEELDRAADFIAARFREAGLKPAGDNEGSYFQTWQDHGGEAGQKVTMKNVVAVIPGKKSEFADQSVVVGAHYDHLGLGWPDVRAENRGKVHPGADDNASGVSVLIELAGVLGKNLNPDRSVVLVAFTGEEAGKRGSKYYIANEKRYPAQRIMGMVNLDTVGRLGKGKLLVLGAGSAGEWMHILRGAGFVTGVEVETVSERLDSSDNMSFEEAGIPAVQLFTGPHPDYHRPTDRAEKIDREGLLKVASVAREVIEYLSTRDTPLTVTVKAGEDAGPAPKRERKVSLGTIPDFTYRGAGCRLSGVVPGSPADAAGLREGDVILEISGQSVRSLKDFSDFLKSLDPGARIAILFTREGKEITVQTGVVAK